jgi:hypothetical protein
VNDLHYLLFDSVVDDNKFVEGGQISVIDVVAGCNDVAGGADSINGELARVVGIVEGNTGADGVGSGWHGKAEVTIIASAQGRWDGSEVGIDFPLQLLDGGGICFVINFGQNLMRKREFRHDVACPSDTIGWCVVRREHCLPSGQGRIEQEIF